MKYHILTAVTAFLLGLSIGSLALGQKRHSTLAQQIQHSVQQDSVSASIAADGKPDKIDSSALRKDANPQAADAEKEDGRPVSIKIRPMAEPEHIQLLTARWANQESILTRLDKRISDLEQQIVTLISERAIEDKVPPEDKVEALTVATPEDRRVALMVAGVMQTTAEEIVSRQSELDLERLELQDQAMREEWYRTDRYYEELRELNRETVDLRAEIGEQAYDEYLYQTGESNCVQVTSVIQGSAAELSGLQPGDIVVSYGDERIYDYSDLRSATANGERGESVPLLIRRGDTVIETEVSRGPMGVRIEALTTPPGG